jgi:hypothetical protein
MGWLAAILKAIAVEYAPKLAGDLYKFVKRKLKRKHKNTHTP